MEPCFQALPTFLTSGITTKGSREAVPFQYRPKNRAVAMVSPLRGHSF